MLLYGHYDVVAAGDEAKWDSPPFEATERDGAIFGRGTADSKSNILVHVGALRAWEGKPPVGIKILIEGQEEVGSALETPATLEPFRADAIARRGRGQHPPGRAVADRRPPRRRAGLRRGADARQREALAASSAAPLPTRSSRSCTRSPPCTTRTATSPSRACAATPGRARRGPTTSSAQLAEMEPGHAVPRHGGLGERLSTGPAITVIGIDVPSVDGAVNAVSPYARARLNVRVHPEQDAAEAQAAVIRHLEEARPFGIPLRCTGGDTGNGFAAATTGPAYEAALGAFETAWGSEPKLIATGGSIPLVKALSEAAPDAEILLYGTTDGFANIHGPNERVLVDEFEKTVLAETLFFQEYAERAKDHDERRRDRSAGAGEPEPEKKGFQFPSTMTVLIIVTFLVWLAAFLIPSGTYERDESGVPAPGSYRQIDSPQDFGERVGDFFLAPGQRPLRPAEPGDGLRRPVRRRAASSAPSACSRSCSRSARS